MRTQSAKAKGRRLCLEMKELLHKYAPDLKPGDIEVTSSGATGEDLKLSPAAREKYPLVIECKNVESISIWKAFHQACSHLETHHGQSAPTLFFRRNHSDTLVCLRAEDFLKLIS